MKVLQKVYGDARQAAYRRAITGGAAELPIDIPAPAAHHAIIVVNAGVILTRGEKCDFDGDEGGVS